MPARTPPPSEMSWSLSVRFAGSLEPGERPEALGLEQLHGKDRRNADGHLAEALGTGDGKKHLLQIDAGLAAAEDACAAAALGESSRDGRIGRVHPAVPVHGHRDGIEPGIAFQAPVAGDIGDEKPVAIALHLARRREAGRARAHHPAPRAEKRSRDIDLVVGMHDARGIERSRRCIAAVGHAGAGQRLLARPIAFLEVALGGMGRAGCKSERERGNGTAQGDLRSHVLPPEIVLAEAAMPKTGRSRSLIPIALPS